MQVNRLFFQFLAIKDEWFSDDLKKMDDENVFRKIQGHWIIEMSEMIATANAKSIEEIKSFLSRRKETYKTPYDKQAADRLRQCVFGGTSNTLDFLPLDRSGNRRFLPIMVYPDRQKFIFWRMQQNLENILTSYGQKLWYFIEVVKFALH